MTIILTLSLFIQASSIDLLIESQSTEELLKQESFVSNKERLREDCRQEEIHQLFPMKCFQNLLASVETFAQRQEWMDFKRKLNLQCEKLSKNLVSLSAIQEIKKMAILTPGCRRALEEQQKDLLYIHQKESWSDS